VELIATTRDAAVRDSPYAVAMTDWLACACAGVHERAPRAVGQSGDDLLTRVAFAATAGHVHDFDDTFSDGVAHVSATCAPAALVVAAELGATLRDALEAYAEAFEAMAACAAASHPALYAGGWHPTAVCGPIGAAVAAARLLELSGEQHQQALRLALLRTGGTRGAFGSDGKAIQVGLAAAHGVQAARLALGGARVSERAVSGELGFEGVFGAQTGSASAVLAAHTPRDTPAAARAIERNWIKLYPSCLGTHSPIEAALLAREHGHDLHRDPVVVRVHPVARQAAHLDDVADPLEGKFSIPYCVGLAHAHGSVRLSHFTAIDPRVRDLAHSVTVELGDTLPEFGAVLECAGEELARVPSPAGSPMQPIGPSELAGKVRDLTGDRLAGILDDLDAPAARALSAARLSEHDPV
jgi:2-methylcitrate dehydratase PrpD